MLSNRVTRARNFSAPRPSGSVRATNLDSDDAFGETDLVSAFSTGFDGTSFNTFTLRAVSADTVPTEAPSTETPLDAAASFGVIFNGEYAVSTLFKASNIRLIPPPEAGSIV